MPFGPYTNFDDCVAKNGDKSSPPAFCAWLEHQITGTYPSQNQAGLPDDAWNIYFQAYSDYITGSKEPLVKVEKEAHSHALSKLQDEGWFDSRLGWIHSLSAPKFRTVTNVRIFAGGTWTDSSGMTKDFGETELDRFVEAFNMGIPGNVPLKCGHTPDSFNQTIAEKLGVPVEVMSGLEGKGQISIGRMATMERRGNLLMASFERVPEQIADLIDGGLFNTVSVEIEDNIGGFDSAITAVALLGAEEPAVDEATLDRALVFGGKRQNAKVISFTKKSGDDYLNQEFETLREKMTETIKGMRGAPVFRALMQNLRTLFDQITKKSHAHQIENQNSNTLMEGKMSLKLSELKEKLQAQAPEAPADEVMAGLMAIAQALGLEDGATIEDIIAAIEAMKQAPPPEGAMSQQFQKMVDENKKDKDRIAKLEHSLRVSGYLEQTRLFTAIPDSTPREIAVELAEIEETRGEEKAKAMLATYEKLNKMGVAATKVIGSSLKGKEQDAEAKIAAYMKDHPEVKRHVAVKAVMRENPELFEDEEE